MFPPTKFDIEPKRQAFLSELGFLDASFEFRPLLYGYSRAAILPAAKARIAKLPGVPPGLDISDPEGSELEYVAQLSMRISSYVRRLSPELGAVVFEPEFRGCGLIDACKGDVLAGFTLVEFKNVDRPFRSTDWRQCLTYCLLNQAGLTHSICEVALMNPRRGLTVKIPLDELALEASGSRFAELGKNFEELISGAGVSR